MKTMERNRLVISLPLPSRALNPHPKGSWRPKADATRKARAFSKEVCRTMMQVSGMAPFTRAGYTIAFYCDQAKARIQKGYCPRDDGNAVQAVKAYVDGCVDAGIVADDSAKNLKLKGVEIYPSSESGGRAEVVLEFFELEGNK